MTPRAGLVLTPGAFYEQTWERSTRRCHIANIKSLRHPVSEKKKLKMGFFVPMFQLADPKGGAILTPGANLVEVLKEMLYTKY